MPAMLLTPVLSWPNYIPPLDLFPSVEWAGCAGGCLRVLPTLTCANFGSSFLTLHHLPWKPTGVRGGCARHFRHQFQSPGSFSCITTTFVVPALCQAWLCALGRW